MSASGTGSESLLGRDRVIVLASLLAVAALAWLYLWIEAVGMESMPMMAMNAAPSPWSLQSLVLLFVMWTVMMAGMMLPSALPAIMLYASMSRSREGGSGAPAVWIFTAGYLAVWTLFSLGATLLQAWLNARGLVSAMMTSASVWLSAGVLLAAGLYQWLPVKEACLRRCRSPLQLFLFRWRAGFSGAFRMGAEHGAFCVGCCWALMLVLFAAGVMNLLWIALLAALVLLEKLLPGGIWIGRLAGVGFAAAGAWLLAAHL